jgi:hypothetical protein
VWFIDRLVLGNSALNHRRYLNGDPGSVVGFPLWLRPGVLGCAIRALRVTVRTRPRTRSLVGGLGAREGSAGDGVRLVVGRIVRGCGVVAAVAAGVSCLFAPLARAGQGAKPQLGRWDPATGVVCFRSGLRSRRPRSRPRRPQPRRSRRHQKAPARSITPATDRSAPRARASRTSRTATATSSRERTGKGVISGRSAERAPTTAVNPEPVLLAQPRAPASWIHGAAIATCAPFDAAMRGGWPRAAGQRLLTTVSTTVDDRQWFCAALTSRFDKMPISIHKQSMSPAFACAWRSRFAGRLDFAVTPRDDPQARQGSRVWAI